MSTLDELKTSVIDGDAKKSAALTQQALDEHVAPDQVLNQALIAAMAEVGRLYQCGEYYVPEMLVSARAMKTALELLRPRLAAADVQPVGKIVLGTVEGDLHDIGKNLVGMMLEGAGFQVIDLGTSVSSRQIVDAVRTHQPQIVGLSALLTTTMTKMKEHIQALDAAGVRGQVKIIVGGAPVTPEYAKLVGADGYAADASGAAKLAQQLIA